MVVIESGGINWYIVGILFLQVVLLFALATPENARSAREREAQGVEVVLGERRALRAESFAERNFNRQFVDSGIVARSHEMFVPQSESRDRAGQIGEMTPALFAWVQMRLEGIWSMVYGVYHRASTLGFVGLFAIPVLMLALVDGMVERKTRIMADGVSTPVYYHGAKRAFAALMVAPLFVLMLPVTVSPSIWYGWLVLLPGIVWVSARNVQEL